MSTAGFTSEHRKPGANGAAHAEGAGEREAAGEHGDGRDVPPHSKEDEAAANNGRGSGKKEEKPEPVLLDLTRVADLAGRAVPQRRFIVQDWIPTRQVTLLSGDGGLGKTYLALALQVALATGTPWFGIDVEQCRSIAFFAEDSEDELHFRVRAVAEAAGVGLESLDGMFWRSAVIDAAECCILDARGNPEPSHYWTSICKTVEHHGSRLVILDAAANFFGLDEVKRRQVNFFILLLRRLATEIDGAVVLLAHPSLAGMMSGAGFSGSTAWSNSVRSRLFLTAEQGDGADPDCRLLSRKKSNYAAAGGELRLRWQNGAFRLADGASGGLDPSAKATMADFTFLAQLARTFGEKTW